VDHDDLLVDSGAVGSDKHTRAEQIRRTEYWPFSKGTVDVFSGTLRESPKATACAVSGNRCNRGASSAEHQAGLRRVARCSRLLTSCMNAWQAASIWAKGLYSARRLISLGTMPALAGYKDKASKKHSSYDIFFIWMEPSQV
jgi:hypothetical protein